MRHCDLRTSLDPTIRLRPEGPHTNLPILNRGHVSPEFASSALASQAAVSVSDVCCPTNRNFSSTCTLSRSLMILLQAAIGEMWVGAEAW
jgi:hypothetical protein